MTTPHRSMTRRAALAGLAGAGALAVETQVGDPPAAQAQVANRPLTEIVPVRGKAAPGTEAFDTTMLQIMDRHGVPGAALAITKNGKLALAKGYGWSDLSTGTAVEPTTLFGMASLSKTFTAVGILKLVEQGKIGLDDSVFDILKDIPPPRGTKVNPLLGEITVRQCLNHSGGWDRSVGGDPVNWEPQICRAFKVPPPLTPLQFVQFAMGLPLQFQPGTDQKYSNVGYIILGEVIAKVSGQPYEKFVSENVLKPIGIRDVLLSAFDGKYRLGEAIRYLAGTLTALPPMLFPMIQATGGWAASVVDLARFLTNLDGSRGTPFLSEKTRKLMIESPPAPLKPRENGTWYGLGWDSVVTTDKTFGYFKDGAYQGMRTFMKRLPNGANWVLLYNASMEFDPQDMRLVAGTVKEVAKLVEGFDKPTDVDLFKEYEYTPHGQE